MHPMLRVTSWSQTYSKRGRLLRKFLRTTKLRKLITKVTSEKVISHKNKPRVSGI